MFSRLGRRTQPSPIAYYVICTVVSWVSVCSFLDLMSTRPFATVLSVDFLVWFVVMSDFSAFKWAVGVQICVHFCQRDPRGERERVHVFLCAEDF